MGGGARAGRPRGVANGGDPPGRPKAARGQALTARASRRRRPAARAAQPVLGPAGPDPGDVGKKITGRKRHLLTVRSGLPLRLVVHAANVQDRDRLGLVCAQIRRRFPWLTHLFADAGYQGLVAGCAAAGQGPRLEIVKRPVGIQGPQLLPRRGVVDRSFAPARSPARACSAVG